MNLFNNREIAMVIIGVLVIFTLMLISKDRKKSFLGVLKENINLSFVLAALSWLFCMIAYTAVIVFGLYHINFWNISLLNITFFWFCSAIVMCVNSVTLEKDQKVFKEIIYNNIKILIVIAFIVNFYTFSFVVELFLISILTCIVFYNVSHRRDGKKTCVFYLMNGLLIIIIIFILFLFVSNVVSDYKSFVNLDSLIKFLLPPLLTFLFLPFIYFFVYICKN